MVRLIWLLAGVALGAAAMRELQRRGAPVSTPEPTPRTALPSPTPRPVPGGRHAWVPPDENSSPTG